jgi:catechol 2,3-dioxygenase-like lactoylglutathione lyase family enzyme
VLNHIGLTVSDLDASVAFYCDIAGMEVVKRYPRTGDDWFRTLTENAEAVVEAAMLELGTFRLQLVQYHEGGSPGGTGHAALGGMHICIEIDDVDAMHAALSMAGRYRVGPIVGRGPYGGRSFYVHDPDGVPVELERRDL